MKKHFLALSILALASLNLHASCGSNNSYNNSYNNPCTYSPCAAVCAATPCCYPSAWYVSTKGALTWRNHLDFDLPLGGTLSTHLKTGGGANIAMGYNFQCVCMRFEGELLYQRNSFKSFTLTTPDPLLAPFVGTFGVHGAIQDLALMANLYYDFCLLSMKFYLGAGIGADFNRISFSKTIVVLTTPTISVLELDASQNKTYFAWNAMAGFSYPLTECWFLDLGYRIWGTNKIKLNLNPGNLKSNIPLVQRAEFGFRYNF